MFGCTSAAKLLAYKALVCPYLEYGCTVWSPHTSKDICALESVQRTAERWINSKYNPDTHIEWIDICLKELRLPTLELHRQYYAILMLYSILHGLTPLSFNNHFQFNQLPTRSHLLTLTARTSTINA